MKTVAFLIMVLLVSKLSSGQVQTQIDTIKSFKDINLFVKRFYKAQADSARNNCWRGCAFVRFGFDQNQKLINVKINDRTPPFVRDALLDVFKKLNRQSLDIEALKPIKNRMFIQPVIIVNDDGCGIITDLYYAEKRDVKTEKIYRDRQIFADQYISSFLEMLSFSGKELDTLDCVVLAPVFPPIPMF